MTCVENQQCPCLSFVQQRAKKKKKQGGGVGYAYRLAVASSRSLHTPRKKEKLLILGN